MSDVWVRTGSCNRCADCCKPPVMKHPPMLNGPGTACKQLGKKQGLNICKITDGMIYDPTPTKPGNVPQADYDYWVRECQPYPNPDNRGHRPPIHALPAACGFTLEMI